MRSKIFSQLLFVALIAASCAVASVNARAQEGQQQQQPPQQQPPSSSAQPQPSPEEEEMLTRGAFLTTRPKATTKSSAGGAAGATLTAGTSVKKSDAPVVASNNSGSTRKSSARPPVKGKRARPTASPGSSGGGPSGRDEVASRTDKKTGDVKTTGGADAGVGYVAANAALPRGIGLGYTLFTLGDNGEAVRTDPSRSFRSGEAIRIALETNTDGYLYIFHTENDGEPTMIFPDVRLNGGINLVNAHVPYEIPSSQEASEERRWFVFKDPPADERLYVILTREPLAGVPTSDALASYCSDTQNVCPWRPTAALWTELRSSQEREQVAVSRVKDQGRAQTSDEREATTRGLGLGLSSPQPTIIRMTASPDSKMLITAIDLIHK